MSSNITLIHGDCMAHMAKMKNKQFDLAICDPPYGINYSNDSMNRNGKSFKKIIGDDAPPTNEYWNNLFRVSQEQIIWGANHFTHNLDMNGRWCIWDKRVDPRADGVLGSPVEMAWTSRTSGYHKIARVMHGGIVNADYKIDGRKERIHPTQKPVALYKWLLKNYAKQGDKILDTHGGSCSLAIACYDMGFDATIYEIDKEYYDAAVKRLDNHKKQLTLF